MMRRLAAVSGRIVLAVRVLVVALLFGMAIPAGAVEPDEVLPNPALESRARALSEGLRCLVCQNQSIDDSSAPLARDLRLLVRERLSAGDSDGEVLAFVVQRYGEFVLLRPPINFGTALLWGSPLLLLLAGGWLAVRQLRAARTSGVAGQAVGEQPLNAAEQARLDEILKSSK